MFKYFFKYLAIIIIATFVLSCPDTNNKPIIKFSSDSSSIIIKNIEEVSLLQVKNVYQTNSDSVKMVAVLLIPSDQDSLQTEEEISGKIQVKGDSLVFSPQKPFINGKTYLVESYIGVQFASISKLLKGSVKHRLQPQRQMLTR